MPLGTRSVLLSSLFSQKYYQTTQNSFVNYRKHNHLILLIKCSSVCSESAIVFSLLELFRDVFVKSSPSFQEGRQICQKCRKRKLTKFCPVYYSLPLTPRLKRLLSSRFYFNLLNYQNYRVVDPHVITDVFDGTNWKYRS
jgi:hypothetical protein